jgi:hypothetical protein
MIMRGIEVADSSLQIASLLTDRTQALYPFVDEECGSRLDDEDRFGGVPANEFFRDDADLSGPLAALEANDAGNLTIPSRVHIAQGTADTTVFKAFTDQLVDELRSGDTRVAYEVYEGAGHGRDLLGTAAVKRDALAFARKRAGR